LISITVSPAAQSPYGAFRLGPDTTSSPANIEFRHFSGYNYYDTLIRGFSHTRLAGAGVSDLGTFGIMPVRNYDVQVLAEGEKSWQSSFSKESEIATPGYYSTYVDQPQSLAEMLSVSGFAGIHRYTFSPSESGGPPGLIVDMCHTAALKVGDDSQCVQASLQVLNSGSSFSGGVLFDGGLSHGIYVYVYADIVSTGSGEKLNVGPWTVCDNGDGSEGVKCIENASQASSTGGKLHSFVLLDNASTVEVKTVISISINELGLILFKYRICYYYCRFG
jgi:putative alpha-1,2-mannosidase